MKNDIHGIQRVAALLMVGALLQSAAAEEPTIDFYGLKVSEALPFDTRFALRGTLPKDTESLSVKLKCPKQNRVPCQRKEEVDLSTSFGLLKPGAMQKTALISIPALLPNSNYSLEVDIATEASKTVIAKATKDVIDSLDTTLWSTLNPSVKTLRVRDISSVCARMQGSVRTALKRSSSALRETSTALADCAAARPGGRLPPLIPTTQIAAVRSAQRNIDTSLSTVLKEQARLRAALRALAVSDNNRAAQKAQVLASSVGNPGMNATQAANAARARLHLEAFEVLAIDDLTELENAVLGADSAGYPKGLKTTYADFAKEQAIDKTRRTAAVYDELRHKLRRLERLLSSRDWPPLDQALGAPLVRGQSAEVMTAADAAEAIRDALNAIATELVDRQSALAQLAPVLERVGGQSFTIPIGTYPVFIENRKFYVSADAGFAYAMGIDEVVPYFGANFYTRPINRDVPLSVLKEYGVRSWQHRLSFTVGVTLASIEEDGERDNLFGNRSLIVGGGYRISDVLRIDGGLVIYNEMDPNPLLDDTNLAVSPYVGLAWDWDLGQTFSAFKSLFPDS